MVSRLLHNYPGYAVTLLLLITITSAACSSSSGPSARSMEAPDERAASEHYPWCDTPPLTEPDEGYRNDIADLNNALDIPAHRLAILGFELQPKAERLQPIAIDDERGVLALSPDAAHAWLLMAAAAQADGVDLVPLAAYRSPADQYRLIAARLAANGRLEAILSGSPPPGYSAHHTGDAIAIGPSAGSTRSEAFTSSDAYAWLQENAAGYCFEPSSPEGNIDGPGFEPQQWRLIRQPAP